MQIKTLTDSSLAQESSEQPRRRIVTVSTQKSQVQSPISLESNQTPDITNNYKPYPLEMQPVLDAVVEYARRTYSLGLLHGAEELDSIVEYISTNLDVKNPQVSQIMNFIQDRSKIFRNAFHKGYGQ